MFIKSLVLSVIVCCALFACDDDGGTNNVNNVNNVNNTNNTNNNGPVCGNGVIEAGEVCEPEDLGEAACETLTGSTYKGGTLRCAADCTGYDESLCIDVACPDSLSFVMRTLDSTELVNLCDFEGQVLLLVNTASSCGYTYQYEQLQDLYEAYSAQGFSVLAFPSNNFMNQESKDECDIRDFLDTTYQITFPVFEKILVVGLGMHALYVYLTTQTAEALQGDIEWNFTKFLIDRTGVVTHRFAPNIDPNRTDVTGAITTLLAE